MVVTKFLNPQNLRLFIQQYVGTFFRQILDVKPKHKKDYYTMFGWMVSKRLAYAVVIIVGVACTYYIFMMSPVKFTFGLDVGNGFPTYDYDSWGLKNFTGKANIKAESRYIAYTGDLKEGTVEGAGVLYDKDGKIIYEGAFAGNMFNGQGKLKYSNGKVHYEGEFVNNKFQGQGTFYRKNGTLEYSGLFTDGLYNGQGTLYDEASTEIFKGVFDSGAISYPELLNKTTAEISEMYTGRSKIYTYAESYAVAMEQIDAVSVVDLSEDSIAETTPVEKIIVLKPVLEANGNIFKTPTELSGYFDKKIYEGSTNILFGEVAAFLCMDDKETGAYIDKSTIAVSSEMKDLIDIEDYDTSTELYIRTYIGNGLAYTFYYADKDSPFVMYTIEQAETEE
ncbi:MAG: hypothetical protein K6F52_06840 [Clostridia bacterium]|nr:hypothetical protein [Clostridia bacterium]